MKQGEWDDHAEAIDHYREGLYRIAMGESNPVDIALTYLGEDRESFKEWRVPLRTSITADAKMVGNGSRLVQGTNTGE